MRKQANWALYYRCLANQLLCASEIHDKEHLNQNALVRIRYLATETLEIVQKLLREDAQATVLGDGDIAEERFLQSMEANVKHILTLLKNMPRRDNNERHKETERLLRRTIGCDDLRGKVAAARAEDNNKNELYEVMNVGTFQSASAPVLPTDGPLILRAKNANPLSSPDPVKTERFKSEKERKDTQGTFQQLQSVWRKMIFTPQDNTATPKKLQKRQKSSFKPKEQYEEDSFEPVSYGKIFPSTLQTFNRT